VGATVTFNVAANTATTQRVGTLTVAGQTLTVTQSGVACNFSVSPTSRTLTSAAGSSTTAVTVAGGCTWNATSSASWLTIASGASGNGNGTVTFNATANTSTSQRIGTLTVAGQLVTVTQSSSSSCTFAISPTTRAIAAGGGSSNTLVIITGGTNCSWTANSNVPWITITSGATGTVGATVTFDVALHTESTERVGTLTVAGQTLTVTQRALPAPANLRFLR
jgi:hypothetical protein